MPDFKSLPAPSSEPPEPTSSHPAKWCDVTVALRTALELSQHLTAGKTVYFDLAPPRRWVKADFKTVVEAFANALAEACGKAAGDAPIDCYFDVSDYEICFKIAYTMQASTRACRDADDLMVICIPLSRK